MQRLRLLKLQEQRRRELEQQKQPLPAAKGLQKGSDDVVNTKSNIHQKKEEVPISMPIVVLDSGGWTVKHGTIFPKIKTKKDADSTTSNQQTLNENTDSQSIEGDTNNTYTETPNLTAKLRHQLAVLVGDEIHTVKNKAQLELKHPLERGYCTDLGCQIEVWRRVLQREHDKRFPGLTSSNQKKFKKKKPPPSMNTYITESNPHCAFLLTQPFTPTTLSDRIDEILFSDLGFQRVSKRLVQCMSAFHYLKTTKDTTSCCLVVDSGFSFTHIVPTLDATAVVRYDMITFLFLCFIIIT